MLDAIVKQTRRVLCVAVAIVTAASVGLSSFGQCTTCGTSPAASAFENWQSGFNPYTVGLPVGAQVPSFTGYSIAENLTLLVAINGSCDPEYLRLLQVWSEEVPNLEVVALLSGLTSGNRTEYVRMLGSHVRVVTEPLSSIACAMYQAGERVSSVSFLIDRSATIIYRQVGFSNRTATEWDRIVRAFAKTGALPVDALIQHVLWYGDVVPWPDFDLKDREGNLVRLGPGRPLVIYQGNNVGIGEAAYRDLSSLIGDFGTDVDFVELLRPVLEEETQSIWTFAQWTGLDSVNPEWYALDYDAFVAKLDLPAKAMGLDEQARVAEGDGWRVLYDEFGRLGFSWLLYARPSVTIIDSDGVLVFPCTAYPVSTASGESVSAPGAIEELREILYGVVHGP